MRICAIVLLCLIGTICATPAHAIVANGFETGFGPGWFTTGDGPFMASTEFVTYQGNVFTPTEGNELLIVEADGPNYSSTFTTPIYGVGPDKMIFYDLAMSARGDGYPTYVTTAFYHLDSPWTNISTWSNQAEPNNDMAFATSGVPVPAGDFVFEISVWSDVPGAKVKAALDNIRVEDDLRLTRGVPEPASATLGIVSLVGLTALMLRRRLPKPVLLRA